MRATRTLLRSGVVAALALVPPTSAGAQLPFGKDASYSCVVEASGGIRFNETTKKWEGTQFRTDRKFVLRLKFLKTRVEKDFLGKDETVHDYRVTIALSGGGGAHECFNWASGDRDIVTIKRDGLLVCDYRTLYKFNLKTNRFIGAYLLGYISGEDDKDTPAISGGTCTKID